MRNTRLYFVLFSLVITLTWAQDSDQCGENQKYNDCGSSCRSEPICNNGLPRVRRQQSCITLCVPRCECKTGFVRREAGGPCVPQSECTGNLPNFTVKCRKNEEQVCLSCCGQPTCARRVCDKACPKICKIGCGCKEGFILDKEGGKCIPIAECPKC